MTDLLPLLPAILLLLLINTYIALRYSTTNADPDWAMFNLAGFTGAWYGRDFCDCKTPMIHIWYWILAKIVGADVPRVKFANHFLIGSAGIGYYLITGDLAGTLAYTAIINSPFLWAFHGNISQLATMFLFFGLAIQDPFIAASMVILAVLTEPKLLPSLIAMVIINSWWMPVGYWLVAGSILAGYLYKFQPHIWYWLIEGSIIIPIRMAKTREGLYPWMPWWTPPALIYVLTWTFIAILAKPDWIYWLPLILYVLLTASGKVIRGNHLLPMAAWIAAAGLDMKFALAWVIIEFISHGALAGNIWGRHYPGFAEQIESAKKAGLYLKDKTGIIWVNGMHTEVYIYASRKPPYSFPEQIEIREVNTERREKMKVEWKENPPDYVVLTPSQAVRFTPNGYIKIISGVFTEIYKKVGKQT